MIINFQVSVSALLFKPLGSHQLIGGEVGLSCTCILIRSTCVSRQSGIGAFNRKSETASGTFLDVMLNIYSLHLDTSPSLCVKTSECLLSGLPSKFNFNWSSHLPSVSVYWMHSINALFHILFCLLLSLLCTCTFFLGLELEKWLLLFHFRGCSSCFACKPALY